jgi:hypothetical protein
MQLGQNNPHKTSWDNTNMQPIEKIINKSFSPKSQGLKRNGATELGGF